MNGKVMEVDNGEVYGRFELLFKMLGRYFFKNALPMVLFRFKDDMCELMRFDPYPMKDGEERAVHVISVNWDIIGECSLSYIAQCMLKCMVVYELFLKNGKMLGEVLLGDWMRAYGIDFEEERLERRVKWMGLFETVYRGFVAKNFSQDAFDVGVAVSKTVQRCLVSSFYEGSRVLIGAKLVCEADGVVGKKIRYRYVNRENVEMAVIGTVGRDVLFDMWYEMYFVELMKERKVRVEEEDVARFFPDILLAFKDVYGKSFKVEVLKQCLHVSFRNWDWCKYKIDDNGISRKMFDEEFEMVRYMTMLFVGNYESEEGKEKIVVGEGGD